MASFTKPSEFSVPSFDQFKIPGNNPFLFNSDKTASYAPDDTSSENQVKSNRFNNKVPSGFRFNANAKRNPEEVAPFSEAVSAQPSKISLGKYVKAAPKAKLIVSVREGDDGEIFSLFEVDSKRMMISCIPELDISLDNGGKISRSNERFETDFGFKSGYLFYKATEAHANKIDEFFGTEWRSKIELPETKDPILMWQGVVGNTRMELFEYSAVSMALFTNPAIRTSSFKENSRLKHPDGTRPGYIIGKSTKSALEELRLLVPFDFEANYKKSAPIIKTVSLLEKRNVINLGTMFEISLYDYSEASYALIFNPEINEPFPGFTFNEKLKINDVITVGYVFSKNSSDALTSLEKIMPGAQLGRSIAVKSELVDIIPTSVATAEESIDSLILKMLNRTGKITEFRNVSFHGKDIIMGTDSEVTSWYDSCEIEREILMRIEAGDNVILVLRGI